MFYLRQHRQLMRTVYLIVLSVNLSLVVRIVYDDSGVSEVGLIPILAN